MAKETEPENATLPIARAAQVRLQLDRILASPGFQGANRRVRLLRYLVEQTLEDQGDSLKESVIASEVFERAADYDPQVDSVVRVEVGRLRSRLSEYYGQAGPEEPVHIDIPKGGYRPLFVFREPARDQPPPAAPAPTERRNWKLIAACAAAFVIVAGVLAGVWWRARSKAPGVPASVAVLPFLNLSGDPASEYLADGVSEDVTEALSQSAGLRVVSRTSAFQYKGKAADVREIGHSLGAGAIVEGSIGRRGRELHVVVQLIRAQDGYHLWSETYDGSAADLPSVEARVARAVNRKLSPSGSMAFAGGDAPESIARDPEAHDIYLRAAYELNRRTVDSTRRAFELAQQAAQKDPTYAQPWVLMAAAESQLTTLFAQTPHEAAQRALRDVTKALELDPGNSAAHAQKALIKYTDEWDWPDAEREFRLALAAGSHGSAESLYGWCLMTRGRFAEARTHLQTAADLDPLSLGPQLNQIEELAAENSLEEARRKAEGIARIAPTNFVALSLVASIAYFQHDCAGVTVWNRKLLDLYPRVPASHLYALGTGVVCGHAEGFDAELRKIVNGDPPGFISPHYLAGIYASRGDSDRAISYLEKSAELREPTLLYLNIERDFNTMATDSRLIAIKRRIGLSE